MKKKIFFVAGVVVSAFIVSCFIPLADGNYWWSAWNDDMQVTVVEAPDRIPAGGVESGTPVDPGAYDPTIPEETYEEPVPVYTGKEKGQPAPPTEYIPPAPQPKPVPVERSCIEQAFVADPNSNCTGCIKGVNFSSNYINSYYNAAYRAPYNLRGNSRKRLAILSILSAGYCSPKSKYQNAYNSSTVIPRMHGGTLDNNLNERTNHWRRNQRSNPLFCSTDTFSEIRKSACAEVYKKCKLRAFIDQDCRGIDRDRGNDDDNGGGHTNGSTSGSTGGKEVGPGTNEGAGHPGDRSGDAGINGPGGGSAQ